MPAWGRPLPTADVGYPVAQLGGQLSGGEIARRTGAGRPRADLSVDEINARERTLRPKRDGEM
jgi:hypothetical protein